MESWRRRRTIGTSLGRAIHRQSKRAGWHRGQRASPRTDLSAFNYVPTLIACKLPSFTGAPSFPDDAMRRGDRAVTPYDQSLDSKVIIPSTDFCWRREKDREFLGLESCLFPVPLPLYSAHHSTKVLSIGSRSNTRENIIRCLYIHIY